MRPNYLKLINTNTGGNRNDVLPLFRDFDAFKMLVSDIGQLVKDCQFNYVAGIDAIGFILGTAVAFHFKVGFIAIRKTGKLLEIESNILTSSDRILLVDEWIETGAQVRAAIQLIEAQNAVVAAITAIAMENNQKTNDLFNSYKCLPLTDGRIMGL